MDIGDIEDIVANDVLLHAQNAADTRLKYVKKVRLADDSACGAVQEDLEAKHIRANKGSQSDEHYQFMQMCHVEPIGKKLFFEYCEKSDATTKNSADFLTGVKDYEVASCSEEGEAKVLEIVQTYLKPDAPKLLNCISDESKACLVNMEKSGGIQQASMVDQTVKEALALCEKDLIEYMTQEIFSKYKTSEEFRTYLKWKHMESQPANENCFTSYRLLGRGGFGEVYAYQENLTGTIFACKKIDKKRMKQKKAENTILIEKLVLEKVNSRFVVTLYYAYESKRELNLVMTLLSGGDLKFHIYETEIKHYGVSIELTDRKNRGVSPERCKIYAAQITLAMEHLHSENILYRDMKPENVLLDSNGNCRVADLGLAYILEENEKISGKAGTLGYMPPEMLNDENYAYGVDWFALGCTIYEMCEGRGPFIVRDKAKRKMNKEQTIQKTISDDVTYKRSHPAELLHLIGKLLEKGVDQRLAGDLPSGRPIMDHPYFEDINWERMEAGLVEPPFVPSNSQVNAKNASKIRLASEVEGVKITDDDKKFYEEFATGRNPVPWQQEILDCGVYDEIMKLQRSGNAENVSDEKQSSTCNLL